VLVITTVTVGDAVRISVGDSGTGIVMEPIDAVFQPFVTSKRHGLGLGLAICRSIVDAHGGRMWAVNNGGLGATFHVLLPMVPVTPEIAVGDGDPLRRDAREAVDVSGAPGIA
jgi:signal transduction histidine kinase